MNIHQEKRWKETSNSAALFIFTKKKKQKKQKNTSFVNINVLCVNVCLFYEITKPYYSILHSSCKGHSYYNYDC